MCFSRERNQVGHVLRYNLRDVTCGSTSYERALGIPSSLELLQAKVGVAQVLLSQPAGRAAPLLEASEGVRGGDPHARTHGRPRRALQSEADESGRVPRALSLGEQQEGGVK